MHVCVCVCVWVCVHVCGGFEGDGDVMATSRAPLGSLVTVEIPLAVTKGRSEWFPESRKERTAAQQSTTARSTEVSTHCSHLQTG